MLDLRWVWVGAALIGCNSESSEGPDARELDARVPDARVDASTEDASTQDASTEDASSQDAALPPMRSWQDVPVGPAPTPREVCTRSWEIDQLPLTNGFGVNPAVRFLHAMVDPDGTMLIAGYSLQPFDFGTGIVPTGAFVVALDGACNLLWARDYPGSGAIALGLDAERHPVLVTWTGTQAAESVDIFTLDASGAVLAQEVISTSGRDVVAASASRDGYVLLNTISMGAPGTGPGSDPQLQVGSNVLHRSDGTELRRDVLGPANYDQLTAQRVGIHGEIVGSGADIDDYYGAALVGSSLAKVSAAGMLAWSKELYPKEATTFDQVTHHVAKDGTIAVDAIHGEVSSPFAAHQILELAPDGTSRWDVPITREGGLQISEVHMGAASVVAFGSFVGATRVGNSELSVQDTVSRNVLMQLDRGGAVRWALTLEKSDWVYALDTNARDEVVVAGDATQFISGAATAFVRVYSGL